MLSGYTALGLLAQDVGNLLFNIARKHVRSMGYDCAGQEIKENKTCTATDKCNGKLHLQHHSLYSQYYMLFSSVYCFI